MCGVCGIVHPDPDWEIDLPTLQRMRDVLTHRGPDDAGLLREGGVALAARRLAIVDLSQRGHMPMHSSDRRFTIVYNGEIYNSPELRRELEAGGYSPVSNCDTEIVLQLFARHGTAMLPRLNGMFAFAIWDRRDRVLTLVRDRLGVKPLYYTFDDGVLRFASEPKALFASGLRPEFDPSTWEELLCFRYVAGAETPYRQVRRLLPGHLLTWRAGHMEVRRWWNLGEYADVTACPAGGAADWFRQTFDESVALRRISDVPLGVLLSGGLDSSSVAAALAAQAGTGIESFTVGFTEAQYDERPLAKMVASRWGLRFNHLTISPRDLLPLLLRSSWHNDEPLAHGNEGQLLAISELAKPQVTVLLSGEGADETLCGYVRYRPLRHRRLLRVARPVLPFIAIAPGIPARVRKLSRLLESGSLANLPALAACDVLPGQVAALGLEARGEFPYRHDILAEAARVYPGALHRQAMYYDQHTFLTSLLDRNDRMTMGASIECRVPFLDYRLVQGLSALPDAALLAGRGSKSLLRSAVGHRLPREILHHRKWGFGVPWSQYLRSVPELTQLVQDLPTIEPVAGGPFDSGTIRRVCVRFLAGDSRYDFLVRQLLMTALWYETCVGSRRWSRPLRPEAA